MNEPTISTNMFTRRHILAGAAVIGAGLIAAACGEDKNDATTTSDGTDSRSMTAAMARRRLSVSVPLRDEIGNHHASGQSSLATSCASVVLPLKTVPVSKTALRFRTTC